MKKIFTLISLAMLAGFSPANAQDHSEDGKYRHVFGNDFGCVVQCSDLVTDADFKTFMGNVSKISGLRAIRFCTDEKKVAILVNKSEYVPTLRSDKYETAWIENPASFPADELVELIAMDVTVISGKRAFHSDFFLGQPEQICFNRNTETSGRK